MHAVARQFHVSYSTVWFWVERACSKRLDRAVLANRKPGRAWNRTPAAVEQRIVALRKTLREDSILGEHGARAIQAALKTEMATAPSVASVNRVLAHHGLQDAARRIRRAGPAQGLVSARSGGRQGRGGLL